MPVTETTTGSSSSAQTSGAQGDLFNAAPTNGAGSSGNQGSNQNTTPTGGQNNNQGGQTGGQQTTQTQPGTQTTQTQQPTQQTRPDWLPQQFTDAAAFRADYDRLAARLAAEDSRRSSLPQTPDAYELKNTSEFKVPEGLEYRLDTNDPLWGQAREWAKRHGLSQDAFAQAIDLVAGREIAAAAAIKTAREAESAKLGPTGATRIDAVATWWNSMTGDDGKVLGQILRMAPTAGTVKAFEKLISTYTNQGVGAHSGRRDAPDQPDRISDDLYARMTYSERKEYAARFQQPTRQAS